MKGWPKSALPFFLFAIFLCTLIVCPGCRSHKPLFRKRPSGKVEHNSYTISTSCYRQTVTMRCAPEAITTTLEGAEDDASNFLVSGMESEGERQDQPQGVGSSAPLTVNMMGFEIPGRLIVIRAVPYRELWFIWDNPLTLAIQRWESVPVPEGTRVKMQTITEMPEKGVMAGLDKVAEFMGFKKSVLEGLDLLLAKMQAQYDPSLDAEQLVSVGLRGEDYNSMFQVYEAGVWVDAPIDDVKAWLNREENIPILFSGMDRKKDFLAEFERTRPGEVIYIPMESSGPVNISWDTFMIKDPEGGLFCARTYWTACDMIGYVDRELKQEAGGTRLIWKFASEIPSAAAHGSMEWLMFLKEVPESLERDLLQIQSSVENKA